MCTHTQLNMAKKITHTHLNMAKKIWSFSQTIVVLLWWLTANSAAAAAVQLCKFQQSCCVSVNLWEAITHCHCSGGGSCGNSSIADFSIH